MAILKFKLKGSTLIESLVAMIILSTAVMLAFLSIATIRKSFNYDIRTYAFFEAKKYLEGNDSSLIAEMDLKQYPSFNLVLNNEQYNNNPLLSQISIIAITRDSVILCELRKITKQRSISKEYNNESKK